MCPGCGPKKTNNNNNNHEIMPLAVTWMDPEIIVLSEVSQTKTNII